MSHAEGFNRKGEYNFIGAQYGTRQIKGGTKIAENIKKGTIEIKNLQTMNNVSGEWETINNIILAK